MNPHGLQGRALEAYQTYSTLYHMLHRIAGATVVDASDLKDNRVLFDLNIDKKQVATVCWGLSTRFFLLPSHDIEYRIHAPTHILTGAVNTCDELTSSFLYQLLRLFPQLKYDDRHFVYPVCFLRLKDQPIEFSSSSKTHTTHAWGVEYD